MQIMFILRNISVTSILLSSHILCEGITPAVPSATSISPSASYSTPRITTTFTQPSQCTNAGFTSIEGEYETEIYEHLIVVIHPGIDLKYTTCLPPQLYSSVLAGFDSTYLGPFEALVCPHNWEIFRERRNSSYIMCCPRGYNLGHSNLGTPDRPGRGAVCSSWLEGGAVFDVTTLGSDLKATVNLATAGPDGTTVLARYAFNGHTFNGSDSSSATITTPASGTATSSLLVPITTTSSFISTLLSPSQPTATSLTTRTIFSGCLKVFNVFLFILSFVSI